VKKSESDLLKTRELRDRSYWPLKERVTREEKSGPLPELALWKLAVGVPGCFYKI
jgi:hypothetical protein